MYLSLKLGSFGSGSVIYTWSTFLTSLGANFITSDGDTFKVKD